MMMMMMMMMMMVVVVVVIIIIIILIMTFTIVVVHIAELPFDPQFRNALQFSAYFDYKNRLSVTSLPLHP